MGEYLNMNAGAANYSNDATTVRANAKLAKRQATMDAYKLESDATNAAYAAGDNMMTLRRNASVSRATARVASAISGFAGGSAAAGELSVAEYFEKVIGDAARSSSVAYQNAAEQAGALRRQGETQYNLGLIQADAYDKFARINRRTAPWLGVGGLLQQGAMLGFQYGAASGFGGGSGAEAVAVSPGAAAAVSTGS